MNPSQLAPTGGNAIAPAPSVPATLTPAGLTIEWWPIDRVKPYEKNARVISPKAVEKVAASIKEFGWRQPIVVDSEDIIVVGHVRLLGAQYLRLTHVPVHVASNLSPAQIKAYRLADNRTHEETTWNSELLGAREVSAARVSSGALRVVTCCHSWAVSC